MAIKQKSRTHSGLTQYSGSWGKSEVIHLLKRTHFGAKVADVSYFNTKSMSQAVDEILNIDYSIPSPPVNNYNDRAADDNVDPGETWVNDFNSSLNGQRMSSFKRWWTGQIINHDRTIREKMTLFWQNHFSTETRVYGWPNYAYKHNSLFRANCLKNYRTLVKEITVDQAMLIYLNGNRNTKAAPDENYARELMELFTLGKGKNSKYTEHDVIEGARVLTGWTIDNRTGDVTFDPNNNRHDTDDKTFSSFFNTTTITGQSGAGGEDELDDFIDMIFLQPEVSKHMVRKLYKWFVYYEIDEDTELNVINPLSGIFRNNNYDIKPVLETLFKSEHFYDMANRGALIKSPVDFSAGICRNFDIEFPPATDYVNQYQAWNIIGVFGMIRLQQDIGDPPSVAGWPAYYQIPQYHEIWINSDTLPNRNIISDVLIGNGYRVGEERLKIDTLSFAKSFGNNRARIAVDLIDDLLEFMHTLDVSQAQKDYMKSVLLSGQIQDSYWTDAWDDYYANQSDAVKQSVVSTRLAFLVKYLMNLSEFQLS